MKTNYNQTVGLIEEHYAKEHFEATESELMARYKEDLNNFQSFAHVKIINDMIHKKIDQATDGMFVEGKIVSLTVDGSKLPDKNDVVFEPNFVMHEGKPFIVGPYITHTFELSYTISIETDNKSEPTILQLSFEVNAVGEQQDGQFCITTNIYRNGLEIEHYSMAKHIKKEIAAHITEQTLA